MEISSLSTTFTLPSPSFYKPTLSSSHSTLLLNPTSTLFRPGHLGLKARPRPRPNNSARRRRGLVCNSLFGLGVPELAVIAGVAALVFGPKQLPEIGRSVGKTIKSFQQAAKEFEQELKKPDEPESSDNAVEAKPASETSEGKDNLVSSSKDS